MNGLLWWMGAADLSSSVRAAMQRARMRLGVVPNVVVVPRGEYLEVTEVGGLRVERGDVLHKHILLRYDPGVVEPGREASVASSGYQIGLF